MKLTGVTAMVGKLMTLGLVAGALALMAPAKAQAQGFAIGVQFGPSYHDYARRDFYERERIERERAAFARREAWEQHERGERLRAYDRHRDAYHYADPRGYYGR